MDTESSNYGQGEVASSGGAMADACVAQLTALRFALRTDVTELKTHQDEYREILRKYTRYLAET